MKGAEFILPLLLSTRCIAICGDGRKNNKMIKATLGLLITKIPSPGISTPVYAAVSPHPPS